MNNFRITGAVIDAKVSMVMTDNENTESIAVHLTIRFNFSTFLIFTL